MSVPLQIQDEAQHVLAQFSVRTGVTPVTIVKLGESSDIVNDTTEQREISVLDGRQIAHELDLDKHGFKIQSYATAVEDFFDSEQIERLYYPEMERLIMEATGAAKVVCFDYTVRVGDPEKRARYKVRAPVSGMHNDFTLQSGPQRVRDLLAPEEAEARLGKRFGSINIWRPLSPVESRPLAICEFGSIDDVDWISAERRYPDGRIGGVNRLIYNPDQRWYYFPAMTTSEVILLKCFDSLTDGTARWTAHGSFDDPSLPLTAKPRESIEIRTLYFY